MKVSLALVGYKLLDEHIEMIINQRFNCDTKVSVYGRISLYLGLTIFGTVGLVGKRFSLDEMPYLISLSWLSRYFSIAG